MNPYDPRGGPPNPYPPQYPPQPPYGYGPPQYPGAGYPMAAVPRNDSEATTIFVLGLLGLVACQFLAPVAWIKGSSYRTTCRLMETQPSGLATAGWVCGIVGTIMLVVSVLFMVLAFALSAMH